MWEDKKSKQVSTSSYNDSGIWYRCKICRIDCSSPAGATEWDWVIVIYAAVGLFTKECHPFIMIQDSGLTSCRTGLALAGTGISGESIKIQLTKYNILLPSPGKRANKWWCFLVWWEVEWGDVCKSKLETLNTRDRAVDCVWHLTRGNAPSHILQTLAIFKFNVKHS